MPQPGTLDATLLPAGFQGAFYYEDGTPWATCRSWEITESYTNTTENVLGDPLDYTVMQSISYGLTINALTVDDRVPRDRYEAIRKALQPTFRFVGECYRPDGSVGRYVLPNCVPDGDQRLAAKQQGETDQRDHTFKVNSLPEVPSWLGL